MGHPRAYSAQTLNTIHYKNSNNTVSNNSMRSLHPQKQWAIILAQILSYALIVTFIFADEKFDFIQFFVNSQNKIQSTSVFYSGCLVALLGTINIWLTLHYFQRQKTISDLLVLCAWTKKVKTEGKWISLEEFFTNHLGYEISHGMSECKMNEMLQELRDEKQSKDSSSNSLNTPLDSTTLNIGFESLPKPQEPDKHPLPNKSQQSVQLSR